jgi:hypothetical protein
MRGCRRGHDVSCPYWKKARMPAKGVKMKIPTVHPARVAGWGGGAKPARIGYLAASRTQPFP